MKSPAVGNAGTVSVRTSILRKLGLRNLAVRTRLSPSLSLTSYPPILLRPVHSLPFAIPTDEETSLHLHAALPHGSQVTVMQIQSALQDHRREAGMDYHTRVKEALASLGLRMAEG